MSPEDKAIVEASLRDVTVDDREQLVAIHRKGVQQAKQNLAKQNTQAAAFVRALEMRSYALELLAQLEESKPEGKKNQ